MVKMKGLSPLNRKLLRDLREGWKSFAAIWLICTLAITLYVGIDATWRGMQRSLDEQFELSNMPDLWVGGEVSDRTVRDLEALPGVTGAQRRVQVEGVAKELGQENDPTVMLMMHDGAARLSKPLVLEGTEFPPGRKDTCILHQAFAQAHGLRVGDVLAVEVYGRRISLTICGIGTLPEYVVTNHNGEFSPDPLGFGYACVSPGTLGFLPYNSAFLTVEPGADIGVVKQDVQKLLSDTQSAVMVRDDIMGIKMAMDESQQIRAMGRIFPVVFFIIAAMITWTTMSRLVEKQRLQIGILFSQGYGKGALMVHYTSYGLLLALLGAAGGFAGAYYAIGPILLNMLATLYTFPGAQPYLLPGVMASISAVLAVITGGASALSAFAALRHNPATLLRPKPPGKGRRVLLENIGWLWRRLPFSEKMIQRNLWRSPARVLMGLLGALGCTAMMLTGFGMRDSVDFVLRNYYTQTMQYDACIYLDDGAPVGYAEMVGRRIGASETEEKMQTGCEVLVQGQWQNKQVFVLEDEHPMVYLTLEDGTAYKLPQQGVALTRKASEEYGVGIGDTLQMRLPGGSAKQAQVVQIVDVQLGQGVYVSRSAWRDIDVMPWMPNAVMVRGDALQLEAVEEMDAVERVRTIMQERDANSKVLEVLNLVVLLLVLFSGALALVVFYNLGQLNFSERIRELATLMVLGFTQREMKRLVLRENLIITAIGIPIGLLLGPLLHKTVLESGLPNTLDFVPYIQSASWVYTVVLTFCFSVAINWVLGRKFRQVNMVEALKSVE